MGFGPAALRALSRRASPRPCAWTASIASGRIRVAGRAKAGQRLSLASPSPSPMAPWPQRGLHSPRQRPRSRRAVDSRFPVRRSSEGPSAASLAPARPPLSPRLRSLLSRKPHSALWWFEPPWLHGPQPRPSHRQSPSAPPIDPPPGLVLSPQSPHKSGATSHRKVFVTRHISIDDGPTAPRPIPPPTRLEPSPGRTGQYKCPAPETNVHVCGAA